MENNPPLRWYHTLTLNSFFLGVSMINQSMGFVLPLLTALFVGEAAKAGAYGNLRLWSLMTAVLMQALWGALSDHSRTRWGRRRPFILGGALLTSGVVLLIGSLFAYQGDNGYLLLLLLALLLNVAANIGQAAAQGLIPDLVEEKQRGLYAGVKSVLEIPIPVILVSLTVGAMLSAGNLWGALFVAVAVYLLSALVTLLSPEQAPSQPPAQLNWQPLLNLLWMTAAFTLIILGLGQGVRWLQGWLDPTAPLLQNLIILGLAGLAAMSLAVVAGVLVGVRIGLGPEAARNRSFTWWVVSRLAFLVGINNLSTFAVFYFQSRLGYSGEQAAGPASELMRVIGVAIFAAALLGGGLARPERQKPLLAFSALLAAGGAVVMLLTDSLTVISMGGAVIGLGAGLFYTVNWALGTLLAPKDEAARYLGISNLAGAGAGAIGAYIGGSIADFFSLHVPGDPGIGYVLLFGIYAVLFLVSALALFKIRLDA